LRGVPLEDYGLLTDAEFDDKKRQVRATAAPGDRLKITLDD
jgi:hypothetical protein